MRYILWICIHSVCFFTQIFGFLEEVTETKRFQMGGPAAKSRVILGGSWRENAWEPLTETYTFFKKTVGVQMTFLESNSGLNALIHSGLGNVFWYLSC